MKGVTDTVSRVSLAARFREMSTTARGRQRAANMREMTAWHPGTLAY